MVVKIDYNIYRKIKRAIRENTEVGAGKKIAKEFGISASTFYRIKSSNTLIEYREKVENANNITRNKKLEKELGLDSKKSFEIFAGEIEEEPKVGLWTRIWQKVRRNNG